MLRCPHEERLEPQLPMERTAKTLKWPRLNLLEAFNVIAIKLVVILNHFPGDKKSLLWHLFDAFYVRTYAIFIMPN